VTEASTAHFLEVTELTDAEITQEQFERLCHRYYWAGQFVAKKDVLEVACGAGLGLPYLAGKAHTVKGGDYSPEVLARARRHIESDIALDVFDAQHIPHPDQSFDVVLLFEALYYIPVAEKFIAEAHRVLRPGGALLIVNANKDLYDFNPSPFSTAYHGAVELRNLLKTGGFQPSCFGYLDTSRVSMRQRLLRPAKAVAAKLGLIPKTMEGKLWLKRLVFGKMNRMPSSIADGMIEYVAPEPISMDVPDRTHKIIYCTGIRV
jgi:SAM-dependent methyltransferase